jgi:uncharacterized coiled-coil protein SlyX
LPGKLDRSDLSQVEVLASRLQKFSEFKDTTHHRLTELEITTATEIQPTLAIQANELNDLRKQVVSQSSEFNKLAPRTELRILAKELERLAVVIDSTATQSSLNQVILIVVLL